MRGMKKKLLHEALRIARDTLAKHPQQSFKHWAFIVQNGKIVEWSVNMDGEPPVHFGYHSRLKNNDLDPKLHAEFTAFRKARGLLDFGKRWECINIRLNNAGEMRLAAPCKCCHGFLSEMGCHTFHFTTDAGWCKIL